MNRNYIYLIIFAFLIAGFASFFASGSPDGLEKVAEDLSFIDKSSGTFGIMPDYIFPGISSESIATFLSGIIGVFICFIFFFGIVKVLKFKTNHKC